MKFRDQTMDVVKGIAIILMVAMHAQLCGQRFVYLFHMPVFFLIAGYFFRTDSVLTGASYVKFVWDKLKRLWLPYAFWIAIFIILTDVFVKLHVYDEGRWRGTWDLVMALPGALLHRGYSQIGGVWFIDVMFFTLLMYAAIEFVFAHLRRDSFWFQSGLAFVFVMFGRFVSADSFRFLGGGQFFACYALFHLGRVLRCKGFGAFELGVLGPFAILCMLHFYERVSLNINLYRNGFTLVIASLAGWYLLRGIAKMLQKHCWLANSFSYVGKRTLSILIFHFYFFKLVSAVGVLLGKYPAAKVAEFPVAFKGGAWWAMYTIVGVLGPLGLCAIWDSFKDRICHASN